MLVSRWTIVGVLVVSFAAAAAAQDPPPVDANTARLEHEREDERERLQHEAELIQRERDRFAASSDDHMKRLRARISALRRAPRRWDPPAVVVTGDPTLARRTFLATNAERARRGLRRLRWGNEGARIALGHNRELAARVFSPTNVEDPDTGERIFPFGLTGHQDLAGGSPWDRMQPMVTRCGGTWASEGIAFSRPQPLGSRRHPGPALEWATRSLMSSQPHRDDLLNPRWTYGAVGVARSQFRTYVTQVYWNCAER